MPPKTCQTCEHKGTVDCTLFCGPDIDDEYLPDNDEYEPPDDLEET